jgi:ribosomal protein L22
MKRVFAERVSLSTPLPCRNFSQQNRVDANESGDKPIRNPVLDEYKARMAKKVLSPAQQARVKRKAQAMPESGALDKSSIFEDDRIAQEKLNDARKEQEDEMKNLADPAILAAVLDPVPAERARFMAKKVVETVRRRGRVSKELVIKRTEREHLVRSHNMKTSVKKLGMLARQIAGKRIDDAIVQMRFSKKAVAREVLKQLEYARDQAIVMRGMGLGLNATSPVSKEGSSAEESSEEALLAEVGKEEFEEIKPEFNPVDIQLKSGSRYKVSSPTDIYIDQAWVGRGPYGKLPDYRARGRVYLMRTPFTSLSVVLKEEKTRIREWSEREEKRKKARTGARVWQHLPDRPLTNHRAWYNW